MTLFKNKYRIESTRLKGWDYSSPGLYFVTVCAQNRECFFGDVVNGEMDLSPIGDIVADEWIVMPNHIHGIIVITDAPVQTAPRNTVETFRRNVSTTNATNPSRLKPRSIGAIIGQIKSICTKRIQAEGFKGFDWQKRFWDEIIWNERALNAVRTYIINNPANWEKDKDNPIGLRM
ncbi:MAG: transposase [Chloroflexi bacterium]|nr:transposase [Chloroflexota bacterium]